MALTVTSSAFAEGETIPAEYTCDSETNASPPLAWTGAPEETASFAVICDDPDAPRGVWVHWLLWNLPGETRELAEALPKVPTLPNDARQGTNSGRETGYDGPCPPLGTPHRYYFKVYALDAMLEVPPSATRDQLERAMDGHVLAEGAVMGRYGR